MQQEKAVVRHLPETNKERIKPMTVLKKDVVTTVAYLLGVKDEFINQYFSENPELLKTLYESREAGIIRSLCQLRTALFKTFKKTDNEIRFNLGNIDRIEWIDATPIHKLKGYGIDILKVNYTVDRYLEDITGIINSNIDNCRQLFEEWLKFDYIKELFIIPKYTKKNAIKNEQEIFMANRDLYPYTMYMHWTPSEHGNLLSSDKKLIQFLYEQHNDYFIDNSKTKDATEETKQDIYDFINSGRKIVLAVDCENSDVFKLYGVLKNLNEDELSKIDKIMLFDDVHTSTAWEWLSKFIKIPVEYICVERITYLKSLVDIKMTAEVCNAHYKDDADSFILLSSDSDFWGLISSLPNAKFFVMYEYSKCGQPIKDAMELHGIYNCSIDDFYTGNATELKRKVLIDKLKSLAPEIVGKNARAITRQLYEDTRITYTEQDFNTFYEKYVKTMRLKIDSDNNFYIDVCDL